MKNPIRFHTAEFGAALGVLTGYFINKSPAPYEELLLGTTVGYFLGAINDFDSFCHSWFDKRNNEGNLEIKSQFGKTEDAIEQ
jgi:hypothetical protein